MLSQPQIDNLWQSKMGAEARSYHFGELASRESSLKRFFSLVTFVAGSATVVSLLSKGPGWLSVALSLVITLISGYTTASNQDGKIKTLGQLHIEWLRLEHDYDRLWSHVHDDDAESELDRFLERERSLSETAATEVGYNEKRWKYWLDTVHEKYKTTEYAGSIRQAQ